MSNIYIAVSWPETQELLEDPEFLSNSTLINSSELYDEYGSSSYMVRVEWLLCKHPEYKPLILNSLQDLQK